jgi:hypothetical protein
VNKHFFKFIAASMILGFLPFNSANSVDAADAEALRPLKECIAERRSLSVLFLVDTSQSLKRTDSKNVRVAGLQSAVSTLDTLRSASAAAGDPVDLFVEFLDFGTTTRQTFADRPRWGAIGTDSDLSEAIRVGYEANNNSEDTDYIAALEPWSNRNDASRPADEIGALEMLELAPPSSCRLLVWFTDGKFDIDFQQRTKTLNWTPAPQIIDSNNDEEPAETTGEDLLCKSGGLADRLREGDIASGSGAGVAVVALGNRADFDLIGSVATGQGPFGPCGSLPSRGIFLPAADVAQLVLQLRGAVLGPDNGPGSGTTGIDTGPTAECEARPDVQTFDYPFLLNQGLTAFNLLTLSGASDVNSTIVAPDGSEYRLTGAETVTLPNGAGLTVVPLETTNGGFQVNGSLPPDALGWAGQWRVRFCTDDSAAAAAIKNNASIYVFGGLQAQLRNTDLVARKGRDATLIVELVSVAGQPATETAFQAGSELIVTVNGEPMSTPPVNADGTFEFTYPIPTDFAGDALDIAATLRPVIRLDPNAPDVRLAEWSGSLGSIRVEPLPKYPLVDPPALIDETLDQERRIVETTFRVDATAAESGGCIALSSLTVSDVDGGTGAAIVSLRDGDTPIDIGADCAVRLADGEARDLTMAISIEDVTITQETVLDGSASFVSTSTIDPTQTETFDLAFSARVLPIIVTDVDEGTVWLLVALALLLPIALLYIANWYSARLDLGRLALAEIPVTYMGGRLWRRGENGERSAFGLLADDMHIGRLPQEGRHRMVGAGGVRLRGRWPWNPFRDVFGEATADGASVVVANHGSNHKGTAGKLAASLTGAWVFRSSNHAVKDDAGEPGPVSGTLTLLVAPNPDVAQRQLDAALDGINERIEHSVATHAVTAALVGADPMPDSSDVLAKTAPISQRHVTASFDPFGDDASPVPVLTEPVSRVNSSRAPKAPKDRSSRRVQRADTPSAVQASTPEPDLPF